jgi:hypothetical protein
MYVNLSVLGTDIRYPFITFIIFNFIITTCVAVKPLRGLCHLGIWQLGCYVDVGLLVHKLTRYLF